MHKLSPLVIGLALILCACTRASSVASPIGVPSLPSTITTESTALTQGLDSHRQDIPIETSPVISAPTAISPTIDPTVIGHFLKAKVETVGNMDAGIMIVVLQIPGGVKGKFEARLDQIPYQCTIQESIPDRLYCYGQPPGSRIQANFAVYGDNPTQPIFETKIDTPALPTPEGPGPAPGLTPSPKME